MHVNIPTFVRAQENVHLSSSSGALRLKLGLQDLRSYHSPFWVS